MALWTLFLTYGMVTWCVHLAYVLSCLHSSGSQDVEGGKMESRGGSL